MTPSLGLLYGINPQPYLISAFSIKLIGKPSVIIDKLTTSDFGLFYGISPQPYLILAFLIKLIGKLTLSWSFLWSKFKLQILQVHLIIIRE